MGKWKLTIAFTDFEIFLRSGKRFGISLAVISISPSCVSITSVDSFIPQDFGFPFESNVDAWKYIYFLFYFLYIVKNSGRKR